MEIAFRYIGDGSFIPGIPARDLTHADIENMKIDVSVLSASKLYVKVENKRAVKSGKE